MTDFNVLNKALIVAWIPRIKSGNVASWKIISNATLGRYGRLHYYWQIVTIILTHYISGFSTLSVKSSYPQFWSFQFTYYQLPVPRKEWHFCFKIFHVKNQRDLSWKLSRRLHQISLPLIARFEKLSSYACVVHPKFCQRRSVQVLCALCTQ